jgi:hypothetical protein
VGGERVPLFEGVANERQVSLGVVVSQRGPELWNTEAKGSTVLGVLPGDNR